jgi:hypothetical protein
MIAENLKVWNALKRPPKEALRTIGFGALKGKSDIDPMWRVKAMTEQFGPCGVGWKFEIKRVWCEPAPQEQVFAFAEVWVYTAKKTSDDLIMPDEWSAPIPGIGGNMLVKLANGKPKDSDEGYKMAVTDALGTAMKMIGVAADIYMGKFDGSMYVDDGNGFIDGEDLNNIKKLVDEVVENMATFLKVADADDLSTIPVKNHNKVLSLLNKKKINMSKSKMREPGEDDA